MVLHDSGSRWLEHVRSRGGQKEVTLEVSLSVRMADARVHASESLATRLADLLETIVDQGFVK